MTGITISLCGNITKIWFLQIQKGKKSWSSSKKFMNTGNLTDSKLHVCHFKFTHGKNLMNLKNYPENIRGYMELRQVIFKTLLKSSFLVNLGVAPSQRNKAHFKMS